MSRALLRSFCWFALWGVLHASWRIARVCVGRRRALPLLRAAAAAIAVCNVWLAEVPRA